MMTKILVCLFGYSLTMTTTATELCSDLATVLQDGPQSFVNLRDNFDFSLGHYRGTQVLAELRECQTYNTGGMAEYRCEMAIPVDDVQHVHGIFDSLALRLKSCMASQAKAQRTSTARRMSWRVNISDETVTLRYQRLVSKYRPPIYALILSVTTLDQAAD